MCVQSDDNRFEPSQLVQTTSAGYTVCSKGDRVVEQGAEVRLLDYLDVRILDVFVFMDHSSSVRKVPVSHS